jgi:Trk K+ transport system NAD-binding subunit
MAPVPAAEPMDPFRNFLPKHLQYKWRQLRAAWRDSWILLRQFRRPILLFALILLGSGWLFYDLSQFAARPVASWIEGVYDVLMIALLNPPMEFPRELSLQLFFFILPVLGIGLLAQGLTEFGVMFFNRRTRAREWEIAVASTFSNHIVLIGLGHLGFRVVKILCEMGQELVVISLDPDPNLMESARSMGVPVIHGDGTRESVLESAGIRRARSIILCTQNDSLNLQMALKARSLNPKLDVVIRIFDDEFAASLQRQFGFRALSATGMAAPIFASSAADMDITPPISIAGQPNSLARLCIAARSELTHLSLGEIEERFHLSIVYFCRAEQAEPHPSAQIKIEPGDIIAVLGEPSSINALAHVNH